ncbi:MAG: hypothetical protein K2M50_04645 [Treponemataceae bacterium]|nr:hypothetical protein [Treponemataceae bacterium]
MQEEFFIQHPKSNPTIYAYVLPGVPSHEGFVKVGYTGRDVTERINEQTHTVGGRLNLHRQGDSPRSPQAWLQAAQRRE